MKLASSALHGN